MLLSFSPDDSLALGKHIGPLTCKTCVDWTVEIGLSGDSEHYSLRDVIDLAQECMMTWDFATLPLKIKSPGIQNGDEFTDVVFNLFFHGKPVEVLYFECHQVDDECPESYIQ